MEKKKIIPITPALLENFKQFKQVVRIFEKELNRTINVIDIIGEFEVAEKLGLKIVEDLINPGFDAYDGDLRVQIKATRTKGITSRLSKLPTSQGSIDFDYLLFAKYKHNSDFDLEAIYKAGADSIRSYFDYINSNHLIEKRKNRKAYKDISISQFISISENVFDFNQNVFIKNPKYKPRKKES